jgi:Endonuclease-reverse transcriptase/Reverse transcriptase (RNA-dependent DNA polymerase)
MIKKPEINTTNSIVSWNAGRNDCSDQIISFLKSRKPIILTIQESTNIKNPAPTAAGYTSIRAINILTYISNNIAYEEQPQLSIEITQPHQSCVQSIKIRIDNQDIVISSVYINPAISKPNKLALFNILQMTWTNNKRIITLGDFNSRHCSWSNNPTNPAGLDLYKLINNMNMTIIPSGRLATYQKRTIRKILYEATLDIAITHPQQHNLTCGILTNTVLTSDHFPIVVHLNSNTTNQNQQQQNWKINKDTDWKEWSKQIDEELSAPSANETNLWESLLHTITNTSKVLLGVKKHKTPPRFYDDKTVIKAEHALKAAKKQHQKHKNQNTLEAVHKAKTLLNNTYKTTKNKLWINFSQQIQDGKHVNWNNLKKSKKKETTTFINFKKNGILPSSLKESLDNAAETVAETFKEEKQHSYPLFPTSASPKITLKETMDAVKSISSRTASGPDNIHPLMLKNLGPVGMECLRTIFDNSLVTGQIPEIWKSARMILIPKKKYDKNDANTYRPISITSVVARTMEKLILKRLQSANINANLHTQQYGFKAKHSTIDALFRVTNMIQKTRETHC